MKKNLSVNTVGFATTITLLDLKTKITREYTILGPWESDPENGIISYLSPLGQQLYKKKAKEKIQFTIDNQEQEVSIENIQKGI